MRDPVVASDGHSYERTAIQDVLDGDNKKSPLTREALTEALTPNRALRRMINGDEARCRCGPTQTRETRACVRQCS